MSQPAAARKHDGRVVAFDAKRLAKSISGAVLGGGEQADREAAEEVGERLAAMAVALLARESRTAPSTEEVREAALRAMQGSGHELAAAAYAEQARTAAAALWRLRVGEDARTAAPWDRQRLAASLRGSGVASDPAGEVAKEVERRLIRLGDELATPALLHALAILELLRRGLDQRRYAARRIAVRLAAQTTRQEGVRAAACPLAVTAPVLEAFWLQAVHSPEVAAAARSQHLGLAPWPTSSADAETPPGLGEEVEPTSDEGVRALEAWGSGVGEQSGVAARGIRADTAERRVALAQGLARQRPRQEGEAARRREGSGEQALRVRLQPPVVGAGGGRGMAGLIALNVAGALAREAIREIPRATLRLAQLLRVAAQAHREREEYFALSPVRGRRLPLGLVGLLNAGAWLNGRSLDQSVPERSCLETATVLLQAARSAVASRGTYSRRLRVPSSSSRRFCQLTRARRSWARATRGSGRPKA
jgi:hypothetical protein